MLWRRIKLGVQRLQALVSFALATKDQQLDFVTLPTSKGIGWIDGDHIYLVPDLAWNAAEEFNSREGWPFRKTQLHKQLADQGVIEREDGGETEARLTVRATLGGSSRRVFKIHKRYFEDAIPDPEANKRAADTSDEQRRDDLAQGGIVVEDYDADFTVN